MTQRVARAARTRKGNSFRHPAEPDAAGRGAIAPDDEGPERLGEKQPDDDVQREDCAGRHRELIGERIIGAGNSEDDQDRHRDPMPMQGEGYFKPFLAGVILDEAQEPGGDVAARANDDQDDNKDQEKALGQDGSVERGRCDQNADPGARGNEGQNGEPVQPQEPVGAFLGDRRDPYFGPAGAQIQPQKQHVDLPLHQAHQHDGGDLALGARIREQDPEPELDDGPERQQGEAIEDRQHADAPQSAVCAELSGKGVACGSGQATNASLDKERRSAHDQEQGEIGPQAAAAHTCLVETLAEMGQVRPDIRVSGEDLWIPADGRDDLLGQRFLAFSAAWLNRRWRRHYLRHQSLLLEGLKHRLPDRLHQLVILLLGHPRRRWLRLRLRLPDNQSKEHEKETRQTRPAAGAHGRRFLIALHLPRLRPVVCRSRAPPWPSWIGRAKFYAVTCAAAMPIKRSTKHGRGGQGSRGAMAAAGN